MTKEDIKQICQIYDNFRSERNAATIAYNSDDTFLEHILATYNLSQSSLPSNLDEAAHRYAWEKQEHHIDFDGDEYLDYGPRYDAFKAGAKWDAAQGVSMLGRVGIYGVDVESITKELREAGFNLGEEIILQIRKKQ